ncbi:MAG: 30S ribosomal protein S6 [Parcubacteria group bacterium]
MQYELFYLIGSSKEAELAEIKKEVEGIVTVAGGKFLEKETLEKRRLSYEIKHENHGVYLCRRFELEEVENLSEIIKNLNLNTRLLRFLISKASELPELKSKEERMADAAKRDSRKEQKEVKPEARKMTETKLEEKTEAKVEIKLEEKAAEAEKNEDIDKKLEEILNI